MGKIFGGEVDQPPAEDPRTTKVAEESPDEAEVQQTPPPIATARARATSSMGKLADPPPGCATELPN